MSLKTRWLAILIVLSVLNNAMEAAVSTPSLAVFAPPDHPYAEQAIVSSTLLVLRPIVAKSRSIWERRALRPGIRILIFIPFASALGGTASSPWWSPFRLLRSAKTFTHFWIRAGDVLRTARAILRGDVSRPRLGVTAVQRRKA